MQEVTVRELRDRLNMLIRRGLGNYPPIAADDNEENGYHGMFNNAVIYESDMLDAETLENLNSKIGDSNVTDISKCVIIG